MYSHADSRVAGGGGGRQRRSIVSPVQPLAILSVFIPIFVILVYAASAWHSISPSATAQIGPVNKESVFKVNWTNAIPPGKTAFAFFLAYDRWDSYNRLLGVRTAIETLRLTGTTRDIVVLVTDDVPDDARQILQGHGAILIDIPASPSTRPDRLSSGPFTTVNRLTLPPVSDLSRDPISDVSHPILGKCRSEFGAVHAWGLHGMYERIVFFEPDILPQLKMDELFLCGKFCMFYNSLAWFNTAVLVLKPDPTEHVRLLKAINTDSPSLRAARSWPSDASCETAWEDFVLGQFPNMISAPAFKPTYGQLEAPRMRLGSGYAVNPLFWYEKYGWQLARVKEYANITGATVFEVPAHAVGWPRGKPWYWIPCIYFNVHWLWHYNRAMLLDEPVLPFIVTSIVCLAALLFLSATPTDKLVIWLFGMSKDPLPPATSSSSSAGASASASASNVSVNGSSGSLNCAGRFSLALANLVSKVGWNLVGYVIGIPLAFISVLPGMYGIPSYTLYHYAWAVFIPAVAVTTLIVLRFFTALIIIPLVGVNAWTAPISPAVLTSSSSAVATSASYFSFWSPSDAGQTTESLAAFLSENHALSPPALAFCARRIAAPASFRWAVIFMYSMLILLHGDIYAHFVLKIFILFFSITYTFFILAAPFAHVLRLQHFAKAGLGRWKAAVVA